MRRRIEAIALGEMGAFGEGSCQTVGETEWEEEEEGKLHGTYHGRRCE